MLLIRHIYLMSCDFPNISVIIYVVLFFCTTALKWAGCSSLYMYSSPVKSSVAFFWVINLVFCLVPWISIEQLQSHCGSREKQHSHVIISLLKWTNRSHHIRSQHSYQHAFCTFWTFFCICFAFSSVSLALYELHCFCAVRSSIVWMFILAFCE